MSQGRLNPTDVLPVPDSTSLYDQRYRDFLDFTLGFFVEQGSTVFTPSDLLKIAPKVLLEDMTGDEQYDMAHIASRYADELYGSLQVMNERLS